MDRTTMAVPGTPGLLRSLNDRTVLRLLLDHGPLTRAQLGATTGLSKPTVGQVLQRLTSHELVSATGSVTTTRGPHATLYRACAELELGLAVEVLPDGARIRLVDAANQLLAATRIHLPLDRTSRSPVADMRVVLQTAADLATTHGHTVSSDRIRNWTLGVPGAIDPRRDAFHFFDAVPGWPEKGVLDQLRDEFGARITIENDVNLAAIAERVSRPLGDPPSFALLWLGEGLGLALDLGGALHRGAAGGAGEIGYLPLTAQLQSEHPGAVDLQDILGGAAIVQLAADLRIERPPTAPSWTYRDVLAATSTRHPEFWEHIARRVVAGLFPVLAIVDPDEVVLGGPLGEAGGPLLAEITTDLIARTSSWTTTVSASALDEDVVVVGGAYIAAQSARDVLLDSLGTVLTGDSIPAIPHPS